MKRYGQFLKELPSRKVVFAIAEFQPITKAHNHLLNVVRSIADSQSADHIIFVSSKKKLDAIPFLQKLYPSCNFRYVDSDKEALYSLALAYKNLVMVVPKEAEVESKKKLEYFTKNKQCDTIDVVSTGQNSADSATISKIMADASKRGDYVTFKKYIPVSMIEIDGKRMMNAIRQSMGSEVVKEEIKFETTQIREQYRAGEIFNVGDKVTDDVNVYEIISRGSNYITVVNESGDMSKKWLDAVKPTTSVFCEDIGIGYAPKQISYKGYVTKNFDRSEDAARAFKDTIDRNPQDPASVLIALKATDRYMGLNDKSISGNPLSDDEKQEWSAAHEKARESLNRLGEFAHHEDYWHMHQHEMEDSMSNFKETGKAEFQEAADEVVAVKKPKKIGHSLVKDDEANPQLATMKARYFKEESDEFDEDEIDDLIDNMKEDDIWHAYDDDELVMIDAETGEEVGNLKEELINEVLSRAERIRAKVRFANSESKRERKIKIALRTRSSSAKINSRARRLAIALMKQRIAKKPLEKLSVAEKERIEAIIARRRPVLNRIAMKLVPRIRKIEATRLSK